MFKVEPSGFNLSLRNSKLDDWKGNRKISKKRKVGSICVEYCLMTKRIKDELRHSPDVSGVEKWSNCSTVREGEYADYIDSVLNISNEDGVLCSLNTEETIDDIPDSPLLYFYENVVEDPLCNADATAMKRALFHGDQEDVCQLEADDALTSISHLDSVQLDGGKAICILNTEDSEIPCNDDILIQIHPSFTFRPEFALDSTTVTEDDIICSFNSDDTMDYIPESQWLDSPENVEENPLCHADATTLLVATPRIKCHSESKVPSFYVDQQGVCHWEADVEVSSKSHHDSIQLREGNVFCILNKEDSKMPCDDNNFLQTHPSPSLIPQIPTDIIDQLSSSSDKKECEHGLCATKYPAPSFTWSQDVDSSTTYSEMSLRTEVGSLNTSISDHNNSESDAQVSARMVKVEPLRFSPLSATSRSDDSKQSKNTREKRKAGSIRIQYYLKRKRIKGYLFNSPGLRFFTECNSSSIVMESEYANHLETIRSFATNDVDRLTIDRTGSFDPSFELKDDSANCSTVTEGDILCSLNTEDTMYDIPNSQLLNSAENVLEDSLCNADGTTLLVATPRIECDEDSNDSSVHGDQKNVSHWQADMVLTSITHLDSVQLSDGKVICNLSTEDSEVPCNDDIFVLVHQSSVRPQIAIDSIDLFSSADLYYESDSAQPHIGYEYISESFDTKCLHQIFGQPDKITNSVLIEDIELTRDVLGTSATYSDMSLQTEVESLKIIYLESVDNSISDHNYSASDDNLPCFSDIEALIHRIDLEYAEESYITREVGRNLHNYSKSTVTRPEQTSLSSLQRAMSSLGALAVFYSSRFKYYIKKAEVTIGRSTKDTDVDIDLRKVGRVNMISRRQATIKMETDGSFSLKNLGKCSITINGNSVAQGQVAALSSSFVIEMSGMKFMFETNERHVRRYLDNIIKERRHGVSRTFEWSPEGEP